jgi:hypothetical protein
MMLKDGAGPILAVQPFHATCFYFEGQTASFGVERPRCEGLSPEESTIPKGFAGEERDGRRCRSAFVAKDFMSVAEWHRHRTSRA